MKHLLTAALVSVFVIFGAFITLIPATPVMAENVFEKACTTNPDSAVCKSKDEGATREDAGQRVQAIINTILMVLGIVAVLVIIIAGFRYVTSQGDEAGIKTAKNAILYAVIGLVIAMLAYVIVNFFVFSFTPKS